MRSILTLFLLVACSAIALAQPPNSDCSTAALLCAQQTLAGDNTGAVGLPGFCVNTNDLVWYTFVTNSVGGVVNVDIDGINCPLVAGMDNELSVVVLSSMDGTCNPAMLQSVSNCVQDSVAFTVETQALLPDTRYWIVVAGAVNNGATIPAQCGFTITTSGPGADVVNVDFDAGPDVTIGQGESTQLNASGGPPYDWSPLSGLSGNNIPDPISAPSESTLYTVTTTINGCTYSDVVNVFVIRRIIPPNTITPNDDGINDTWLIPGIADYPGTEVVIYDRWGQKVFSSNGYREPWDGTNGGRKLPLGTYYYHIQLNQLEGRSPPYTGFISIVR